MSRPESRSGAASAAAPRRALARLGAPAVGLAVVAVLLWQSQSPYEATAASATTLRFDDELVNAPNDASTRTVRAMPQDVAHLDGWLSGAGASAAVADLDGDGVENELCLVDSRDDSVRLIPLAQSELTRTQLVAPQRPDGRPVIPVGCAIADLDADGGLDAIVSYWGRPPVIFAAETWEPEEVSDPNQVWNTMSLAVGDIDGNGDLDLLVGNYFPDGANLTDPSRPSGPHMEMNDSLSRAGNGGLSRLLLGRTDPAGQREWVDATDSLAPEVARAWTLAIGLQDLTSDGLPEIYLANDFGRDHLLVNHSTPMKPDLRAVTGRRGPLTPKSMVLGQDSFKGMGVAFSREPDESRPSIMVSNITAQHGLQESNFWFTPDGPMSELEKGDWPYRNEPLEAGLAQSGWAWDVKAVDLDNDGYDELPQATGFVAGDGDGWAQLQELAMANDGLLRHTGAWFAMQGRGLSGSDPLRLWERGPDGHYTDSAPAADLDSRIPSRGLAVADVDADGRRDLVVARQYAPSVLYLNRSGAGRGLELAVERSVGSGATTPLVGVAGVATACGVEHHFQLFPVGGHAGSSSQRAHVGLGDCQDEAEVELRWRDADGLHTASTTVTGEQARLVVSSEGEIQR